MELLAERSMFALFTEKADNQERKEKWVCSVQMHSMMISFLPSVKLVTAFKLILFVRFAKWGSDRSLVNNFPWHGSRCKRAHARNLLSRSSTDHPKTKIEEKTLSQPNSRVQSSFASIFLQLNGWMVLFWDAQHGTTTTASLFYFIVFPWICVFTVTGLEASYFTVFPASSISSHVRIVFNGNRTLVARTRTTWIDGIICVFDIENCSYWNEWKVLNWTNHVA